MKKRVVMIGSGNVATSLTMSLKDKCDVVQIYSRTIANAQTLANMVYCEACDDLKALVPNADVYIIAVNDDAIANVIDNTPDNDALWLHTSGSTSIEVFEGKRKRYGVCWPVQSFSKSRIVPMNEVHFFIEGCDSDVTKDIKQFIGTITGNIHEATSEDRLRLHVASVFACNFANHMFTLSNEVLDEAGLPFDAMLPLIKTTIAKLDQITPAESQTGPAARGDKKIIEKHLSILDGDRRKIYKMLSQSIMKEKGFKS